MKNKIIDKLINKVRFYKNQIKNKQSNILKLQNPKEKNTDNMQIQNKEEMYYFLTVEYVDSPSYKKYSYISDDTTVKEGDIVLVDRVGTLVTAKVINTGYYSQFNSPYPIEKTKKIVQKIDEDFDIEYMEYYDEIYEEDGMIETIKMNIDSTYFEFGIYDYTDGEYNDEKWAKTIIKIKNDYFQYEKNDELMISAEVDKLLGELENLLKDELNEQKTISFLEPDLVFDLYPKMNLWDTGKYAYIKEGYEIQDIYMKLNINLTNREGVYTGQKYVMIFDREEIEKIVAYIKQVINEKHINN